MLRAGVRVSINAPLSYESLEFILAGSSSSVTQQTLPLSARGVRLTINIGPMWAEVPRVLPDTCTHACTATWALKPLVHMFAPNALYKTGSLEIPENEGARIESFPGDWLVQGLGVLAVWVEDQV